VESRFQTKAKQSNVFQNPHTVHFQLASVGKNHQRQDNPMLIKTINELETGDLSDDGNAFLKSMDRPIPNEESSVHLFARNLEVITWIPPKRRGEFRTVLHNNCTWFKTLAPIIDISSTISV
jgi:hypothetical protein